MYLLNVFIIIYNATLYVIILRLHSNSRLISHLHGTIINRKWITIQTRNGEGSGHQSAPLQQWQK